MNELKKGLDLNFNKVINEKINKVTITRLKHCSELIIKINLNKSLGLKPFDYRIDLNGNYDDTVGCIRNEREKLYKIFNATNDRNLVLKVWGYLEQDCVLPFIGALIDNQIDVWDKFKC